MRLSDRERAAWWTRAGVVVPLPRPVVPDDDEDEIEEEAA